jgi:hypothetical protein
LCGIDDDMHHLLVFLMHECTCDIRAPTFCATLPDR